MSEEIVDQDLISFMNSCETYLNRVKCNDSEAYKQLLKFTGFSLEFELIRKFVRNPNTDCINDMKKLIPKDEKIVSLETFSCKMIAQLVLNVNKIIMNHESNLQKDLIVYRGIDQGEFSGDEYLARGLTSYSLLKKVADEFSDGKGTKPVKVIIPKGINVLYLGKHSKVPHELECILPFGSIFEKVNENEYIFKGVNEEYLTEEIGKQVYTKGKEVIGPKAAIIAEQQRIMKERTEALLAERKKKRGGKRKTKKDKKTKKIKKIKKNKKSKKN